MPRIANQQRTKKQAAVVLGLLLLTSGNAAANTIDAPIHASEIRKAWTEADIHVIARTLAGECYDHKERDKRRVCEVILNRVSSGKFGDTILSVATAPNQFHGYWRQSRPISKSDYKIAAQALQDWHNNGCKALSQYLYFKSGANRENQFR